MSNSGTITKDSIPSIYHYKRKKVSSLIIRQDNKKLGNMTYLYNIVYQQSIQQYTIHHGENIQAVCLLHKLYKRELNNK